MYDCRVKVSVSDKLSPVEIPVSLEKDDIGWLVTSFDAEYVGEYARTPKQALAYFIEKVNNHYD
ncbi:hypothetical protein NVP1208B_29 [Vibrio phage 1.208.B._10N.222.52.A7]|nr:hypothetical protein NVP1208B_29 [Vibrio phage 1.208.B._10N.222.52.A7]